MSSQPAGSDYAAWRDRLAEGLDERFYTIDYIDWRLSEKTAFFMASDEAALVFEFKQYPTGNSVIHYLLAAGDFRALRDEFAPKIEAIGKLAGCIGALVDSRPEWARVLKPRGYEPFQMAVFKGF